MWRRERDSPAVPQFPWKQRLLKALFPLVYQVSVPGREAREYLPVWIKIWLVGGSTRTGRALPIAVIATFPDLI
jgi:hypothetical protein